MIEQIQQQDLQEKIDALTFEIQSLGEELEAAKKAKSEYARELMNDPDAQLRRIEQLAAGHGSVCEFSQEQLAKINNFTNVIRGIENAIVDRHRAIERTQKTITARHELAAAKTAISPKIRKFNECLDQLRKAWEELQAVATKHDVESG